MSLIKANAVQIGQSNDATENFTLAVPSSPDGTIKLARGNSGATTQDVMNVSNAGVVSFPQGLGNISSGTAIATGSTTARSLANRFADVVNVLDFGADPTGAVDSTTEIQEAIDSGAENLWIPDGIYQIRTVTISRNMTISGTGTFKRKDNYETNDTSAGAANNTMFDIVAHVTVNFQGVTFDGNQANQNVNTPSGTLLRVYNVTGASGSVLSLNADGCTFLNMTRAAITIKGKIGEPGEEIATVTNCLFKDCRPGIGAGDPLSTNASGFAPTFINVNDRARLIASNNRFIYTGSVAIGDYAPSAIRFTYIDGTTNANGSRGIVEGNYFYRCGRSDIGYTGTPNANNGLGVIEAYTIGQDIIVANNTFETSYSACVRAKSSCSGLVVNGNVMTDCSEPGVSIGPIGTTNGTQTGKIVVSNNIIKLADSAGVIIVGDSTVSPTEISDIVISDNHISDLTNVNAATGNIAAICVRNARRVSITGNVIHDADVDAILCGIKVRNCIDALVCNNSLHNIGSHGIYGNTITEEFIASSNIIKFCGGNGIIVDSTATPDCVFVGNLIDTVVTYGILAQQARYMTIEGNIALNVSGTSRGFFVPSNATKATVQGNITNATIPIFYTLSSNVTVAGNSWNPSVAQTATNAPTSGTWSVGDIVWRTDPVAGQPPGWVCVTAGTPGTWKAMANLEP